MEDVIRINDRWYVLATSSRADDRTRVLKHDDTFGLFDRWGDVQPVGIGDQGLYHRGTRFLSHFELNVNERRPLLLNSMVKEDNSVLVVDLTTPDLYDAAGNLIIRKGVVHLFRAKFLYRAVHYEHLRLTNYGDEGVDLEIDLAFAADYADIFEVRGVERAERGELLSVEQDAHGPVFAYRGLDGILRRTRVRLSRPPDRVGDGGLCFRFHLPPRGTQELYLGIACEVGEDSPRVLPYQEAFHTHSEELARRRARAATVFTSNEQLNDWINRSQADLHMLLSHTPAGEYPYAGVPWFSTPFGRDGIISALQYLWADPEVARGVLRFLAENQADREDPAVDAEPGKILHEVRQGEMAELGEIPFKRYYGSIDSTPLFVCLAGAYYQRTGDRPFVESIWPNIERALDWIDRYGDRDGDGFVEYAKRSPNGLKQQGWKDSDDSVFHADGSDASPPIALCEVQGYVYRAKMSAAALARLFGEVAQADKLEHEAQDLKKRFNTAFWCDELDTYALALDGAKRPCKVVTSNPGHVLYAGIASTRYARRVARTLLSAPAFNGWGVRTLAAGQARYNPMSYHNGSVWPHDNALIALGLARYGYKDEALRILTGLLDASVHFDLHRLPELFCGFARLPGQGPTLYPVACSPQAWAAGAVFQLLEACLGMEFHTEKPQLRFRHPRLPDYVDHLEIRGLRVAGGELDLRLRRHPNDVGLTVLRKQGDVDVAVIV